MAEGVPRGENLLMSFVEEFLQDCSRTQANMEAVTVRPVNSQGIIGGGKEGPASIIATLLVDGRC